jgi:hypothetical protein
MRRRTYLARAGAGSVAGITLAAAAGCLAARDDRDDPPATLADRPAGVYRPKAVGRLRTVGVADAGPFRLALAYGPPVRFWEVVGEETYLREIADTDDVHLVALAWDPASGVVLPEVGLTVEVLRDGDLVTQEAVYAMVSQGMGFHYGDNFALDGDGGYEVTVAVGGLQGRRTGAFAGRLGESASHTFSFDYAASDRDALPVDRADAPGSRGALPPAPPDGVPAAVAPTDPPGTRIGRARTADVVLDVRALEGTAAAARLDEPAATGTASDPGDDADGSGARNDADGSGAGNDADASGSTATSSGDPAGDYLAVLARTPFNDLVLPAMGLRATVERDGTDGESHILARTLDPELGYHYGTPVEDVAAATAVRVETLTPPQVARHEGYETAFHNLDAVRVTPP